MLGDFSRLYFQYILGNEPTTYSAEGSQLQAANSALIQSLHFTLKIICLLTQYISRILSSKYLYTCLNSARSYSKSGCFL